MFRCSIIAFIIFLLGFIKIKAQPVFNAVGGYANGQAGISVTQSNVFSVQNNQATLAKLQQHQIAIYNSIPFAISNLATSNLSTAAHFKHFNAGLAFSQFGYNLFSQQRATAAMAKKLSDMFSLGIGFSYLATNIAEQPTVHNFIGETGVLFEPKNGWHFGLYVFNPTMVKYGNGLSDKIPSLVRAGVGYDVGKDLTLNAEYEKILSTDDNLRASLQYKLNSNVGLMCGWASKPAKIGFGSNIIYKNWEFIFAGNVHQVLGLTPSLTIAYKK
ncbi:MAG: hypothetical protein ACK4K9_07870 [Bacteroidia bacterium]